MTSRACPASGEATVERLGSPTHCVHALDVVRCASSPAAANTVSASSKLPIRSRTCPSSIPVCHVGSAAQAARHSVAAASQDIARTDCTDASIRRVDIARHAGLHSPTHRSAARHPVGGHRPARPHRPAQPGWLGGGAASSWPTALRRAAGGRATPRCAGHPRAPRAGRVAPAARARSRPVRRSSRVRPTGSPCATSAKA